MYQSWQFRKTPHVCLWIIEGKQRVMSFSASISLKPHWAQWHFSQVSKKRWHVCKNIRGMGYRLIGKNTWTSYSETQWLCHQPLHVRLGVNKFRSHGTVLQEFSSFSFSNSSQYCLHRVADSAVKKPDREATKLLNRSQGWLTFILQSIKIDRQISSTCSQTYNIYICFDVCSEKIICQKILVWVISSMQNK